MRKRLLLASTTSGREYRITWSTNGIDVPAGTVAARRIPPIPTGFKPSAKLLGMLQRQTKNGGDFFESACCSRKGALSGVGSVC
jgi:hypothetical protein